MCTVTRLPITACLPACLPGVAMCDVMCLRQVFVADRAGGFKLLL